MIPVQSMSNPREEGIFNSPKNSLKYKFQPQEFIPKCSEELQEELRKNNFKRMGKIVKTFISIEMI